jgi:hypothetical protein
MFALSRWSGGLVARYGGRLPLIIGPLIVAVGYTLFLRPGIGGNYWATFFGPVAVLGLGMAISVAPLTTVVMMAVSQNRAGTASGVNNAVSRTAGLVAIAVLGVVMLNVFKTQLDRHLADPSLPKSVVESVRAQNNRLAAIEVPPDESTDIQQVVHRAINESFVAAFRTVLAVGAVLAIASALTALVLIKSSSNK